MNRKQCSLKLILASFVVFSLALPAHTFEVPRQGYDWQRMPQSEQVGYCGLLIYGMVGMGNYTTSEVNLASSYFAGRINYYYKTHSLNDPIEKAAEWAWPETKKFLDNM